jgi:hypothetical protein
LQGAVLIIGEMPGHERREHRRLDEAHEAMYANGVPGTTVTLYGILCAA